MVEYNTCQLEHLTLEMLAYGRQKPAYSHFVARIFRKILAEHLTHFIRKLLYFLREPTLWTISTLQPSGSGSVPSSAEEFEACTKPPSPADAQNSPTF